ncbi:MAG: pentapeptide repeat-containing protein [Phycisphaeraceae bacterium]|nr:pentapeptide repeat-containing protein [Phycisphaeraceae bacterium]
MPLVSDARLVTPGPILPIASDNQRASRARRPGFQSSGDSSFRGCDFRGCDFRGCNFRGRGLAWSGQVAGVVTNLGVDVVFHAGVAERTALLVADDSVARAWTTDDLDASALGDVVENLHVLAGQVHIAIGLPEHEDGRDAFGTNVIALDPQASDGHAPDADIRVTAIVNDAAVTDIDIDPGFVHDAFAIVELDTGDAVVGVDLVVVAMHRPTPSAHFDRPIVVGEVAQRGPITGGADDPRAETDDVFTDVGSIAGTGDGRGTGREDEVAFDADAGGQAVGRR